VAAAELRPEWNAMRPLSTRPQTLSLEAGSVLVRGLASGVKAGDSLLLLTGSEAGQRDVRRVVKVTEDAAAGTTRIDLVPDPPDPPPFFFPILPVGQFFGVSAGLTTATVAGHIVNHRWRQADLEALARVHDWHVPDLMRAIARQAAHREFAPETGVFALRQRAALFGHNAPRYLSLPEDQRGSGKAYPSDWDGSGGRNLDDEQFGGSRRVDLDRTYPAIVPGSWLVLESPTGRHIYRVEDNAELSRSDFALSAKVTRLRLDSDADFASFGLRETTVLGQSERLGLADLPLADAVSGSEIVLDGVYLGLKTGRKAIVSGRRADLDGVMGSELVSLADVVFGGGHTTLVLHQALAHSYVRDSVTVNANVVAATHGETVREVLGSGDAGKPFQQFVLRQPPLTHTASAAPSGADSTLEVRVNGLLWKQVPSFRGVGPGERVYTAVTGDDGTTAVRFGDGATGARLPSGTENVQAVYRKGMGSAGNVAANKLSLLLTRPAGVRGVTNPLPASGAADGESRDDMRANAPLAILTLDRIVSLRDYQDFARAFAGIGKALASWTWSGQTRGVFLTVAGAGGAEIAADSPTYANLLSAIGQAGDPRVPVRLQSYRKALFRLAGTVTVAPDHAIEPVLAAVEQALRGAYAFEARGFGEPVGLSEVVGVIQNVAGVVAVDLDTLVRIDGIGGDAVPQAPGRVALPAAAGRLDGVVRPGLFARRNAGLLPAALPQTGRGAPAAAELLLLDPRPLPLTGVRP
jgi:hypothetical protein